MRKNNNIFLTIPLLLLICLFSVSLVSAATINLSGGDFNDIQNGVNAAGTNGVLNLGNYVYTGSGDQINISGIDNLVIQGASNSSKATLDGNFLSGIFHVKADSTDITFKNINFINGNVSVESGAGIMAYGTVVVEDCSFNNNYGASGAAIYIQPVAVNSQIINCQFIGSRSIYEHPVWGPPEGAAIDSHSDDTLISGCYFEDNYCQYNGGAVSIALSTGSQIINCVFVNNSCLNNGGTIHVRDSELSITGCDIRNGNSEYGGGIFVDDSSTVTIDTCTFVGNNATVGGGAIYSRSSDTELVGSTFTNNGANYGGAFFGDDSQIDLDSCVFDGNNVLDDGGAIYLQSSDLTVLDSQFLNNFADNGGSVFTDSLSTISINNCTFTNNHANTSGGAMYLSSSNSDITGSDFEGNTALYAGAIFFDNVAGVNLDSSNFRRNTATTGGALYLLGSSVDISSSNFVNNTADYGSAIYNDNNSVLDILSTSFADNLAKTFDIVSPPVAGQSPYTEIVNVFLVCGDNIADAIYNDGGSVAIDGVTPFESTARPNQAVTINISGIIYNGITDSNGVATFNVQTMIVPAMTQSYVASYQQTTLYTGISKTPSLNVQAAAKVTTTLPKTSNPVITPSVRSPVISVSSQAKTISKAVKKVVSYWNFYLDIKKYSASDLKSVKSFTGTWFKYDSKNKKWVLIEKSDINSLKNATSGTYRQVTKIDKATGEKKGLKLKPCIVYKCTQGSSKWTERVPATQAIYLISNLTAKQQTEFSNYLKKSYNCQVGNTEIVALSKKCIATIYGELTPYKKAKKLFEWLRNGHHYKLYPNTLYGALKSYHLIKDKPGKKILNCADHSHLLIAMLRSVGIPAIYEHGQRVFSFGGAGHYWPKAYASGKWYNLDPTNINNKVNGVSGTFVSHKSTHYHYELVDDEGKNKNVPSKLKQQLINGPKPY